MFVFVFEGELFAFIVNGDRFVLLALLPRRKPRTDRTVQLPYHSVKELNLTSSRLLRFAYPIWRLAWISVSTVQGHTSTLFVRNSVWGLPQKKSRSSPSLEMTSIFRFSAPTALRRYGCLRFRSAGAAEPRSLRIRFRSAALTSFGRVYVFYSDMRQQVPKPKAEFVYEGE